MVKMVKIFEEIIRLRNFALGFFYRKLLRKIFFSFDPEIVHNKMILFGEMLGSNFLTKNLTELFFNYSNTKLSQDILNINFKNPVGLSAGFDKDANLTEIILKMGFGFEEIGSITGEPCEGNVKPRLWRLKNSKAILVNYGLKNKGSEFLSNKLNNKKFKIPILTSIAKTNCKETVIIKEGIKDYVKAYKFMSHIGDISVINISCPNTFGGQQFHSKSNLENLLKAIAKIKSNKPIFLKISPDLTQKQLDDIIMIATKYKIKGFICSNLTKERKNRKIIDNLPNKSGGISGKVLENLSNKQIAYIYKKTKGKFIIIGVGGIFSAEDAYKKIKLGASLVSLITGMIYEGPQLISQINQDLVVLLEKDGFTNISQAVGMNNKY